MHVAHVLSGHFREQHGCIWAAKKSLRMQGQRSCPLKDRHYDQNTATVNPARARLRRQKESLKEARTGPRLLSSLGLTPGTPLMALVQRSLTYYICQRLQAHRFAGLHFELSGATVQARPPFSVAARTPPLLLCCCRACMHILLCMHQGAHKTHASKSSGHGCCALEPGGHGACTLHGIASLVSCAREQDSCF